MVCPNRLFALDSLSFAEEKPYPSMSAAVRHVLETVGITPDTSPFPLGVWSEISIEQKRGDQEFDYRFDFILNPIADMSPETFADQWGLDTAAWSRGGTRRAFNRAQRHFPVRTTGFPLIIEVMTASTSGSNSQKGTGIIPAFQNAWASVTADSPMRADAPGINARQVWARMASQLIAKSETAKGWGGKTVWLMQDKLLDYITNTTNITPSAAVDVTRSPLALWDVNIVSFKYADTSEAGTVRAIQADTFIATDIPQFLDENQEIMQTVYGILHAPFIPTPGVLALKLLESNKLRIVLTR